MIKIAIYNRKGGVGKTTSTVNLGACFEKEFGKRVLLVEIDTQGNMSDYLLSHENVKPTKSLSNVLNGDVNVIHNLKFYVRNKLVETKMDLIASTAEMDFDYPDSTEQYKTLISFFDELEDKYDICLFDCPPSMNNYVFATMLIADYVLVPLEATKDSLSGYKTVKRDMSMIKSIFGKRMKAVIIGAVFNNYNKMSFENKQWYNLARKIKNIVLFDNVIRQCSEIGKASIDGRPFVYYKSNPNEKSSMEYKAVCKELLKRISEIGE